MSDYYKDTTFHQDQLLYAAINGYGQSVFSVVTVDDFDPGSRQQLAAIVERGSLTGVIDSSWIMGEVLKVGNRDLTMLLTTVVSNALVASNWRYHAERVLEESMRRSAGMILTRALKVITDGNQHPLIAVEEAMEQLNAIPRAELSEDDTWTLQDIMGMEVQHDRFTLPNMLRRNERLVLTGSEGGGKSVFVYQLLTGAAYGVDTFTLERTEPQRVLFLDVENNEFQARANLDKIVPALREIAPDVDPDWRSLKRRVVDLLASKDRADVIRRVVHYSPDILYMGTAYKLTDVSDETHRSVRAIQSVVDRIRQEIDCTVIVEHHAGHGHMNDRNNMRPEGSSYWLRWPDFGYGMQPLPTNSGKRLMRLGAWRGDRATDRYFPKAVKQGSVMPWDPIYPDEWEAIYAEHYDKS